MASLIILLPIALIFFGLAIFLFWWSVGNKQFDDLDREGQRILFDEEEKPRSSVPPVKREPDDDA